MRKAIYSLILFSFLFLFISCDSGIGSETKKVNEFILSCFEDIYLWNNFLPPLNTKKESDPYVLFEKLRYTEDKWSLLTDNVTELTARVSGEGTSYGYGLGFYYKKNSKEVIAVVKYVHANSPADISGLKRGDIILEMNGQVITESNYTDLYYTSYLQIGLGNYIDDNVVLNGKIIELIASKTYLDPIIHYSIIEKNNHKIGYIHYTDYLIKSHEKLSEVFSYFKSNNVTDVILDLRYNGGGYAITSQYLCSMLVPEQVIINQEIYLTELWNDSYAQHYQKQNNNKAKKFAKTYTFMNDDNVQQTDYVNVNLDLSRIYILTGSNTASASEATIVSLQPYMDVILIGEETTGKYCGGMILSPKDYRIYDKDVQNWGAYVMVYRYINSQNYPSGVIGLTPAITIEEELMKNPYDIGDENEPLLAEAIAQITGIPRQKQARLKQHSKKYIRADKLEPPGKMITIKE